MRVIVTGASGFVGRRAAEALVAAGHEVHALDLQYPDAGMDGILCHEVDLFDAGATRAAVSAIGASHLLHFAWYAVPGRFWDAPENYRWVGATLALAESFVAAGGRRFVGAGTCAEYDWRDGNCHETRTAIAPATPYGLTKAVTGQLLSSYGALTGLSTAWGRIFFVYGPGETSDRLVPYVIRTLLGGGRAACGDGVPVRDYVHVHDVAQGFARLLFSDVAGPVNIGSGVPVAVRDVVLEIASQIGASDRVDFGALPPRDEAPRVVADVRRLTEEVGCSPAFDLRAGLADAIASWRAFQPSPNESPCA